MRRFSRCCILKADGVAERFSPAKVRRCLTQALSGTEAPDSIATPLAEAVSIHFRQGAGSGAPNSARLFESVCVVLEETGHADAAERLRNHRRARARLRASTRVLQSAASGAVVSAWSKSRIVNAVQRRHGLIRETARMVAAAVEHKALTLGFRTLSDALVDQLVRHELAAWGLGADDAPSVGHDSETSIVHTDTKEKTSE